MNTGIFRCGECSTYFAEAVPPPWLEYWPEHCDVLAPLQFTVGSVAVEMKVAEVLMTGGRSSTPTALLEPEPNEPILPMIPAYKSPPRRRAKSRSRAFAAALAIASYKCMPATILLPTVLLAY